MATFIVWDVFGYSNGNMKHIATFAYGNAADAERLARETHAGYVVRNKIQARTAPQPRADHNPPDSLASAVPVPVVASVPVVRASAYVVWDDVNERECTTDGLRESKPATFASRQDAQAYADRLNTFGNYGGWVSLRFHVRER